MIEGEIVAAVVGYALSFSGYKYLTRKDWGTYFESFTVRRIVHRRKIGPHTLDAIQDINKQNRDVMISLYDDITVNREEGVVEFWRRRTEYNEVAKEGPSRRKKVIIAMATGLIFLSSTGLTIDVANKVFHMLTG